MSTDTFSLKSLASYLGRDARELEKLANQGRLPGQRVGREWRFHRAEVHHWLEREMPRFSDTQLQTFESTIQTPSDSSSDKASHLVLRPLMSESMVGLPLTGRTAGGVLRSLVELANDNWQVLDPVKILQAIRERETVSSTAFGGGVALPHPGRRLPALLSDSMIVFGRTNSPIPFGGEGGQLTDLYFLVLCRDDRTHLQCLARLSRIIQRAGFLNQLRHAGTPADVLCLVEEAEEDVQ